MIEQNAVDCSLNGEPPYNCQGCDLSGLNLAGKDIRGANLKSTKLLGTIFKGVLSLDGADLSGATMGEGTDFSGCDLTKTVFSPAPNFGSSAAKPTLFCKATVRYVILGSTWQALNLSQATILGMPDAIEKFMVKQCDISGIDFSKKTLTNAHFSSVVAHNTIFSDAILDNIVFNRTTNEQLTDLTGAKFDGASISSGVFDDATLTGADFSNAKSLSNATFLDAKMDGTIFDHTDLTSCSFTSPPWWSKEPGNNTSFKGATLNLSVIGKVWSYLDLTDAKLVGLVPGTDLTYLAARYAVLSRMDLSGYTLDHSDFRGGTLNGVRFVGSSMNQAILRGARGEQAVFDGAVLTWARFDSIDHTDPKTYSSLHGASFKGAKLQHANVSNSDFGPAGEVTSDFRKAVLDNLTAVSTDFTGANLSGGLSMQGASFANATLAKADMTGAVLGAQSRIVTINTIDSGYAPFLTSLSSLSIPGVVATFNLHGVQLNEATTTISAISPGKAWEIKDGEREYLVFLATASDKTQSLHIFQGSTAGYAVLSGAFMPDTILNDANLIYVKADGIQLFSTVALNQLAGANMYGISLSDAILGSDVSIDISEAILINAQMKGAFLLNANLRNSQLIGADLGMAQLQGTDFTDAILTNANFTDAAVSIFIIADGAGVQYYGVPLFAVTRGKSIFEEALSELALLASLDDDDNPKYPCELSTDSNGGDVGYKDLLAELQGWTPNGGTLDNLQAAFLNKLHITLSKQTTVTTGSGLVWLLHDPEATDNKDYTVWVGLDHINVGQHWLYAQPYFPNLSTLFSDGYQVKLAWQTTIKSINSKNSKAWLIDNDSQNPLNFQTGYVGFIVSQTPDKLSVFGAIIHATRLASNNKQEMGVFAFTGTTLCKNQPCDDLYDTYLQSDTFCPNGEKLLDNQQNNRTWGDIMKVAKTPPSPPQCVPNDYTGCPSN